MCFEVIALLYFGGWRLLCKGDGEYDASDEKGMGTTSPFPQPGDFHFPQPGDFHFEKIVFHDLAQVRTRYPGVEALIRGNALHVDGRRFIWKGQVLSFLSMFSKKLFCLCFRV